MDRFIIKRNIHRLYKRNFIILACIILVALVGSSCSKEIDYDEIWAQTKGLDGYGEWRTRTYVSMPAETEEQQFEIIKKRVLNETYSVSEQPKKIENFINTPQYLYATATYEKDVFESIVKDNKMEQCTDKEINRFEFLSGNNFESKPEWWDVCEIGHEKCFFAHIEVKGYAYYEPRAQSLAHTSQRCFVSAVETDDKNIYKVYFACENGLRDELVGKPECYMD